MTTVNQYGERTDIVVRQGVTAGPFLLSVKDGDGVAVDLSGVTFEGGIFDTAGTTKLLDWDYDLSDLVSGNLTFSLSDTTTEDMLISKLTFPPKHTWIINMIWTDGTTIPAYYGDLRVIVGDGE